MIFPPEKRTFLSGEYWEDVFLKHRDKFRRIEDFYQSIENWDFKSVEFSAEKFGIETIYYLRDDYLNQSKIIESKNPLTDFLRLSIKSRNYPKDGCEITVSGNFAGNFGIMPKSQIIVVELYYYDTANMSLKFIYSPKVPLSLNVNEMYLYEFNSLGEGWYFLKQWPDPRYILY